MFVVYAEHPEYILYEVRVTVRFGYVNPSEFQVVENGLSLIQAFSVRMQ